MMAENEHGHSDPWPPEEGDPEHRLVYTIGKLQPPAPGDVR